MIDVEGIFLRDDYSEIITEKFVRKYSVLLDNWIYPFGYYDQFNGSVICNGYLPDGLYILLGRVDYPGIDRYSYHTTCQFNACRNRGIDLNFISKFNPYSNIPTIITLKPKFPLFKIGELTQYKELKTIFPKIKNTWLTKDEIYNKMVKLDKSTIEYKVYALKLALMRFAFKEK